MLNIRSSAGRRLLLSLPFITKKEELEKKMNDNATFLALWNDKKWEQEFSILAVKLSQLRDINTTIKHLSDKNRLDDVELFEIKHFAILSETIREILLKIKLTNVHLPNLSEVIQILDPENKQIPHFYIYNQYSNELEEIRKKMDLAEPNEKEQLYVEAEKIEDNIRAKLSEKLVCFNEVLSQSLTELAQLDISLAKAELTTQFSLTRPGFSDLHTIVAGMFHPQLADVLSNTGNAFQKIDIEIRSEPTIITGANMAGKTVLLKTVALIQTLAQYGFYVPAVSAQLIPVEKIYISSGDSQNELNGLSSFAAEMIQLNEMAQSVKKGKKLLVLIDELARTTNPKEGQAIVCGMTDFLIHHHVSALITTHYSIGLNCRKLRVKGFTYPENKEKIDFKNINQYIDYSLEESSDDSVPHEALQIAEIIGVDEEILQRTKAFLKD